MKRLGSLLIFLLSLSIVLTACGGGGGGGATPPQQQVGTSSVKISGLVGSGAGAGGGRVAKAQAATQNPLANANVKIDAFDKNKNKTDSITVMTGPTGAFSTTINLSNSGGYIIATVEKAGYSPWSKRIDFAQPSDVNIQSILDDAKSAIIPLSGQNITISSTGKKVVKIALFEDKYGRKSIVTGQAVALRKQQNGTPTLEIEIPVAPLQQEGITALKADLNSFDPIEDAALFPGQYRDSNGNPIVSLGFDYINITDNKGVNLGSAMKKAIREGRLTKAQVTGTKISRWIYSNICPTLLADYCTGTSSDDPICNDPDFSAAEEAGFNVPVYTYNPYSGLWEMLGVGTLDINNDGLIDGNDVITDTDNPPDGTADEAQQWCTNGSGGYLVINISNEAFLRNYWNLDYPLIFEQPKELCIEKTFKIGDAPAEGLWVELYDDDGVWSYSTAWNITDENGKVKLSVVLTNSADSDTTGIIGYTDPYDWSWKEETVTLGESPNCTKKTNPITKPAICEVEGYVKDDTGKARSDEYVYIYSEYPNYFYNEAYTNANGYFKMDARCDVEHQFYVSYNWTQSALFRPNGTITGHPDESDDKVATNDWLVTLKNIVMQNQAPYTYGWIYAYSIYIGETVPAYIWSWDLECDMPLNWVVKNNNTNLASGTWNDCWGEADVELPAFNTLGTYDITLEVTDSKGKTGTAQIGTVSVIQEGQNLPPDIWYAYPDEWVISPGETVTLYGGAYDWDGDNINWQWKANNVLIPNTGCSGSGGSYIDTECSYTMSNQEGCVNMKLEVTDPSGSNQIVSWDFNVCVGVPGNLDIIIQKKGKR